MKNLTIEQKAKRYDEAIKIAKSKIKNDKDHVLYEDDIIEIFPELKKKTDEEMIQKLIAVCHLYYGEGVDAERDECLEWLEKQGKIDKTHYDIAEKEKREFVSDGFIKCYANFQDFKEGETYWLEYIGDDNYNVRSDNLLGKTYHITPCQLYTIFKKQTWLEKQSKNKSIERKGFTSIPFGAFDSELYESMITIPDGCVATIEGNKICIKREDKSATETIKEEKVDNSNKIEPKINIGDYVVRRNGKYFHDGRKFAKVIKINKTTDTTMYLVDCEIWLYEIEIKPWSISDAKDGDILTSPDSKAFIYNGNFDTFNVGSYCGLDINDDFVIADNKCNWCYNHNIKPATTEQRQALFKEMNLIGYIWYPETKELNRLDENNKNNN